MRNKQSFARLCRFAFSAKNYALGLPLGSSKNYALGSAASLVEEL